MMKQYAVSITFSVVGLIILVYQFVFPDPIPDLVIKLIERDNSMFIGLDFVLKAFLLLYMISGIASLFTGIVTALFIYKRSQ